MEAARKYGDRVGFVLLAVLAFAPPHDLYFKVFNYRYYIKLPDPTLQIYQNNKKTPNPTKHPQELWQQHQQHHQ